MWKILLITNKKWYKGFKQNLKKKINTINNERNKNEKFQKVKYRPVENILDIFICSALDIQFF